MSDPQPEPSDQQPESPEEERKRLFKQHSEQAWQNLYSSSDEHDKAVLTLSSAILGASLAFIKDIVHLSQAVYLWLLPVSWGCFAAAVVLVVASLRLSLLAHRLHITHLEKYYDPDNPDPKFFNPPNPYDRAVSLLNWFTGPLLALGIVFTILFAWENVLAGRTMADSKENVSITGAHANDGRPVMKMEKLNEGRIVPKMTAVTPSQASDPAAPDLEKGRVVQNMTPLRQVQSPAPVPDNPPAETSKTEK